jgi:tRNA(Arg) A34 adenosine deaminase TadA
MEDRIKFMKEAIELAKKNLQNGDGGPFGAVVVKDGKIVGRGYNKVVSTNDPTAHAEVNAIRDACKNLNSFHLTGCEIYTSCEPCPMCLGTIYWSRIEKIFYAADRNHATQAGFDDSFIYDEINIDPAKRSIPSIQLLERESEAVFNTWIKLDNKIEY